jgi:hypothetical protein
LKRRIIAFSRRSLHDSAEFAGGCQAGADSLGDEFAFHLRETGHHVEEEP